MSKKKKSTAPEKQRLIQPIRKKIKDINRFFTSFCVMPSCADCLLSFSRANVSIRVRVLGGGGRGVAAVSWSLRRAGVGESAETINEEGDGTLREAGEWHSSKEARSGGKRKKKDGGRGGGGV